MFDHSHEAARKILKKSFDSLSERERRVVRHFAERIHISRDSNQRFQEGLTLGQRLADRVAAFGGSWTFILIFAAVLSSWILLNSFILARRGGVFDPYPYILLNLLLSMIAALQAPIIMMSQNRQAAKDRMEAAHDYEVNLKAELEICALHEKLDYLRDQQLSELIAMQGKQMELITMLLERAKRNTTE